MEKIEWQILQEINRYKSLSKAADCLFLSQPAITYRVNKMEKEFGKPLFVRGAQGTSLNENGMQLLSFAARMIQYEQEIRQTMHPDTFEKLSSIEIGTTGNFFNLYHVHQIRAFRNAYPDIRLNIKIGASDSLYRSITEGKLMMGVMREVQLNHWEEEHFLIFNDPLMIASVEPISQEYLMSTPLIRNQTNPYLANIVSEWVMNNYKQKPLESYIDIWGDSRNIAAMIKAGLGWSILTESRLESTDELYMEPIYKPDGTPYRQNTYLIYRKDAMNFSAYAAYIDHFTSFFTQTRNPK